MPPDRGPFSVDPYRLNRVTESRIRGELERRDTSGSGVISENSLRKVLEAFGVDLVGADLGRLMHRFDTHEVKIVRWCVLPLGRSVVPETTCSEP